MPEVVSEWLPDIAVAHERIWLAEVDVHLTDPQRLVARWLDARYDTVLTRGYGANTLRLYAPDVRPPQLTVGDYAPQHTLDASVGTRGRLWGWELPVTEYPPGSTIFLSLLWAQTPEEQVSVSLRNAQGRTLLTRRAEQAGGSAGVRQQFDFAVYASTPAGTYDIVLSPAPKAGATLGSLRVVGTAPLPRSRPPDVAVNVRMGDDVVLEGYSVRVRPKGGLGNARPGDDMVLDLYWRANTKLARDYTVFTHFLGTAHNPRTQGPVWGQHDSAPADGGLPTTQWFEGETVIDRHVLRIDQGAPPGEYRLEVGMYTWEDGKRLAIWSENGRPMGDHVLLETLVHIAEP